jgi:ClpP class serine protease
MKRRSKEAPRRYEPSGLLAVDPKAFFEFFMVPESRENEAVDGVEIVDICGPLEQHDRGWCDSYEAIRGRVQAACESGAQVVLLRIDSPGGDVGGCFDTARAVRDMCRAAGKPLYAFVENKACSAGYALASAANVVVLSESAIVGSIGVLSTRNDFTAQNASRGIRIELITSGPRKADGHPDAPITEAELKDTQALVDSMAGVFFQLVADMRGSSPEAMAALNARVFHGQAAIDAGLADVTQPFDSLLALLASGGTLMATAYDKARAALEEAAKGDDANAAAAKRALAAMAEQKDVDGDDDAPPPKKDDDAPPPKKDDEASTSTGDAAAATSDDDEATPPAKEKAAREIALQALAEVHTLKAERVTEKRAAERAELLASRPDFSPELRAALETADMKTVRNMVATLPKGTPQPKTPKTPTTAVAPLRGTTQGGTDPQPLAAADEMDIAMGLAPSKLGCRKEGNSLVFGLIHTPLSGENGAAK